jgi:hypothetical protein
MKFSSKISSIEKPTPDELLNERKRTEIWEKRLKMFCFYKGFKGTYSIPQCAAMVYNNSYKELKEAVLSRQAGTEVQALSGNKN